jgi:UDP-2-acetamido-3-amino-2,3-dideoxy-glucuronate N-acetyltransferase
MGKNMRVVVIGTGYWGKNLIRNFFELGALTGVCDQDIDLARSRVAEFSKVSVFENAEAVAEDPAIDAVAIATPAVTHGALTRQFLEAGKNVFVEKPLCLEPIEAEALGGLADSRGLTLMVGHLLLYHPAFQALREVIEQGDLGHLRYIYSNRASLGKVRTEESALWSFAPHDVSMILALAGRMPKTVIATGAHYLTDGVADTTLSHLSFSDDLQAHIFVSWLHPFKDHRLVVVGSDGMIVFDDVAQGEKKLLHFSHVLSTKNGTPEIHRAEAVPVAFSKTEPLLLECNHFLKCAKSGKRPISDWHEATQVLKVLKACESSILSGASATA